MPKFVICMTFVALGTACSTEADGPRIAPSEGGFSTAVMPNWRAEQPFVLVNALGLCLDRPGMVEIVNVSLEHAEGGMRVDAFATRVKSASQKPNPQLTGSESLTDLGLSTDEKTVGTACPTSAEASAGPTNGSSQPVGYTDLAIQFSKPSNATARGAIIAVRYKSAGTELTHRVGFQLVLCEGDSDHQTIEECQPKSYKWPQ